MSGLPALLCDADGCLFPSEEPAYDASAQVTTLFLEALGIEQRYSATQLRTEFTGLNFRSTGAELARRHGVPLSPDLLDHWVGIERDVVTHHLTDVLRPDASVRGPLEALAGVVRLAVVTSSASARIDACLTATGLADIFPAAHRFSAEDLRPPASKPDPAVYLDAARRMGAHPTATLAVEDSTVGVRAAVAAGVPVVGLTQFVLAEERDARRAGLMAAGAVMVVESWDDVAGLVERVLSQRESALR